MMHRHKPFHHKHHSPWDHSTLSQYWHAGFWPLWPKHHCVQNATVTKTPPNIYATKNFRHCDQNATVAKTPPKIFAMHLITIVGFFWLVFQSAFTECTLLTIYKNMYFYIFGIISLPCFINSLPSANITNNHLDTTLIYLVTTLQWYKSLS